MRSPPPAGVRAAEVPTALLQLLASLQLHVEEEAEEADVSASQPHTHTHTHTHQQPATRPGKDRRGQPPAALSPFSSELSCAPRKASIVEILAGDAEAHDGNARELESEAARSSDSSGR